jgi:hypothetical protein
MTHVHAGLVALLGALLALLIWPLLNNTSLTGTKGITG